MATVGRVPVRGAAGRDRGRRAGHRRRAGRFEASLVQAVQRELRHHRRNFWTAAPSDPTPYRCSRGTSTYIRPGTAYIALRQILGRDQLRPRAAAHPAPYGGGTITEAQLEAGVRATGCPTAARRLPGPARAVLPQWFDTAYPPGGGGTGR